jgi:hypothetical protein
MMNDELDKVLKEAIVACVFARSNTGIVGSNHTEGMDVCLCCVCVVLCR